jgi:hypothetical protein
MRSAFPRLATGEYKKVRLTPLGVKKLDEVTAWADADYSAADPIATPFARIPGRNGAFHAFFEPDLSNLDSWVVWMLRAFDSIGPHPPWHPDD